MEATQTEVAQIQIKEIVSEISNDRLRNLLDLQLAFTGGGMADTIPF